MKQETKIFVPFYGLPFCFRPFDGNDYWKYTIATVLQLVYYFGTVIGLTALLS